MDDGGGGGGGGAPAQTQTNTTELPEWARPYAKDVLAKGAALTDINQNPYQTYGANRIAGFSPMQQQSFQGAANMQPSRQLGTASDMAEAAGMGALGANYQAGRFSNQFRDPGQYQPGQFSMSEAQAPNLRNYQFENAPQDVQAQTYNAPTMQGQQTGYNPNLQSFQMDPAERVRTRSFAQPGSAEAYMSPYMQNVVDIQKREAQRQSAIQGTQQQAQAVGAGAFGGSRDAIMRAERERNLGQQMGDIQATGQQAAFQNAQQQFNAEQQARLQAQQANQQAGLTVGGQNLGARLGVQQLGTQTGLQTALANLNNQQQAAVQNQAAQLQTQGMNAQQALQAALANQQMGYNVGAQNLASNLNVQQLGAGQNLQAQLANQQAFQQAQNAAEQSRQFGAGQGLQAANLGAQYGQSAQQLGEQSRQYGAGLGMQGLQTGLQAAGQLGQLGGQQFQQGMDINKLQSAYGGQMQQQAQRPLDQAYQDFLNQQNYPYKQLGFMSDMIRGLPLGQQSTQSMYQAPGSMMGQLGGLGMGAYGVSQLMKADGGTVHDYAEGGVTSDQNVEGILSKLSDQQLQQAKQAALARRDAPQAQMIDQEISMRASARSGISAAITPEFADEMEQGMATGGIVAFADRGAVKEIPEKATSSVGDFFNSIGVDDAVNALRESYYKTKEGVQRMERAEDVLPGVFESMTPSERARRKAAGAELFKGPKDVAKMTPQEIEAAKAITMGPTAKPSKPSGSLTPAEIEARNASVMAGNTVDKSGKVTAPKSPDTQATEKKYEALFSGPKPTKAEVKSAVSQFAEQKGATPSEKEDYMATALKIREELGKQNQPILDKLNAAIDAQKPNEQALKDRGIGQAFAQFGFAMAERASKPGARFLESAAGASPVLAAVAEKTNSLIDTQKQNYTNLRLDQAKYEVALAKGDMSTAAALAGQIRQANQQDQMLKFQIAKAQDELALKREEINNARNYQGQMASRYETIGSLTKDIMQNEGLPYDKALEKAGRLMRPTGYAADVRAGTAQSANLDKALKDIDAKQKYMLLGMLKPDNPRYGPLKADYDAEVKAAYARHGGGATQTNAPQASLAQKGFKLLGTE
jgi:hypothetical protein